ncbi:MAG: hypothetical protein JEY79_19615 [Pseudodesulfovibrio sp.]|nr:hypothetical protein [Pseudodesulfovibrio sp.]
MTTAENHQMAKECREMFTAVDRRLAQGDVKLALQDQAISSISSQVADIHKVVVSGNGRPPIVERMTILEELVKKQWWVISIIAAGVITVGIKGIWGWP